MSIILVMDRRELAYRMLCASLSPPVPIGMIADAIADEALAACDRARPGTSEILLRQADAATSYLAETLSNVEPTSEAVERACAAVAALYDDDWRQLDEIFRKPYRDEVRTTIEALASHASELAELRLDQ